MSKRLTFGLDLASKAVTIRISCIVNRISNEIRPMNYNII